MIDLAIRGASVLEGDDKPDLGLLDKALRRGLSDVTRLFMHVAQGALAQAGVGARDVHVVFASAFGEIATAEAILAQAFDENDASPARFRNSVHNTAPGLYSISTRNTFTHTAVAAGHDSVAVGLLEAELLVRDGAEQVLLVLAEEPVPAAFGSSHAYGKLAAAFVLARGGESALPASLGRLTSLRRQPGIFEPGSEDHPLAPAANVVRALASRGQHHLRVGAGAQPYHVDLLVPEHP
jgi:hypothetical protein